MQAVMFLDMQAAFNTTVKKVYDDEDNASGDGCGFGELENFDNDRGGRNSLQDLPTNMEGYERANQSLCEILYGVTHQLMKSMDTDKGWEDLAAAADFTFDKIQELAMKQHQHDGSPTGSLLWKLGCLNYKVSDLYEKLRSVKRIREMKILEEYVKDGGLQENKSSLPNKKTSASILFSSLPPLNQPRVLDNKPHWNGESGFSAPGSEINFNHSVAVDKSKFAVGKMKYSDKVIPGTDSTSTSSGTICNNESWLLKQIPQIGRSTSTPCPQFPLPNEFLKQHPSQHRSGPMSLPTHLQLSYSSHGADNDHKLNGACTSTGIPDLTMPICRDIASPNSSFDKFKLPGSLQPSVSTPTTPGQPDKDPALTQPKDPMDGSMYKACFSYRELYNATDGFHKKNSVGEGAFGEVFRGTIHHLECAIKVLHSQNDDLKKREDQTKTELAALLKYQHENIVTLYGYAQSNSDIYLVYQYLVHGSLEDRLQRKDNSPTLPWERRLNIMVGTCKGLNFLHTLGGKTLIHGDIKSANILLDQYYEAKIGDLGQAKYATSQSKDDTGFTHITIAAAKTKQFGTKAYMAPEIALQGQQSKQSDVYALGVVFLETCSGKPAYDPNKIEEKFLVEDFSANIVEKDKSVWREEFQDKTLINVTDDIFILVLEQASKCVNKIKKKRPDTEKLLIELKNIYKQFKETDAGIAASTTTKEEEETESSYNSLSSSLQIDSLILSSSQDLSEQSSSNNSPGLSCSSFHLYNTQQMKNFEHLQEQRLEQLQSMKKANSLFKHLQISSQQNHHPEKYIESCAPVITEDSITMRNLPEPESPIKSFPPNAPIPEAFRLQLAYDRQDEKKKIDRLSGKLQNDALLENEYPSDPEKLMKIDEFDREQQIPNQNTALQSHNHPQYIPNQHTTLQSHTQQAQDIFPEADPKKMALLNAFDNNFHAVDSPNKGLSEEFMCDPAKLEYLKNFDDGLYHRTVQQSSCSDTEKTLTTDEIQSNCTQNDYNTQIQPEQQATDLSTVQVSTLRDPHNTPGMYQAHVPHCVSQGLNNGSSVRLSESTAHDTNCRPSDGSNEKAVNSIALGKSKMNNFFAAYKKYSDQDVDDDGGEE